MSPKVSRDRQPLVTPATWFQGRQSSRVRSAEIRVIRNDGLFLGVNPQTPGKEFGIA
jgi:hypothetical protein